MNIIEINDFSDPRLDVYARLTEAQLLNRFEPAKGMFIAESPKVIDRALNAGCQPVSLLMERKDIDGSARDIIARCGEIPVFTADRDVLCQLTGYQLTRGVLCAMRRPCLSMSRMWSGTRGASLFWKMSKTPRMSVPSSAPPQHWVWMRFC